MLDITISDEVWEAIAARGKFGESEDDVLRRVFGLPPSSSENIHPTAFGLSRRAGGAAQRRMAGGNNHPAANGLSPRRTLAKQRMSAYIEGGKLRVAFQDGSASVWQLPPKDDKDALSTTRTEAVDFARKCGATIGQINAVKKALTDAGYYLTR